MFGHIKFNVACTCFFIFGSLTLYDEYWLNGRARYAEANFFSMPNARIVYPLLMIVSLFFFIEILYHICKDK